MGRRLVKASLLLALKLVISIASLYAIARSVAWNDVARVLAQIHVSWILLALAIFWVAQVVSSLRCAYIARALGGNLDLATSVRAHFVGLWFNQVLPTSLGGDIVKIAILKDKLGLSLALRSAILDRFSGLMYLMLAIAVTLPLYSRLFRDFPQFVTALALLSAAFILATVFLSWIAGRFRSRVRLTPVLREAFQLLADIWSFRARRLLWEQFWTSGVVHFNGIAAYALLGIAIGTNVDALMFILVVPIVFLIALLPVSFAGWGVREAGAIWLFGFAGVPREISLAISVCFGLLLVVAALPGLLLFMKSSKKRLTAALQ